MLTFWSYDGYNPKKIVIDPKGVESVVEDFNQGDRSATISMANGDKFTVRDEERTVAEQIANEKANVLCLPTLQKFDVSRGDRIVLRFNEPQMQPRIVLTAALEQCERIFPECKVLILDGNIQIDVFRTTQE